MEKRVFFNPIFNDSVTFLETCKESNGRHTIAEIELHKSDGPPLHYHKAFIEKFEALEGDLHLKIGKKTKVLKPGELLVVHPRTPHKFYNPTNDRVKFKVTLEPGHSGMENFIKILYSLAADGLTDKKGNPKKFSHLASILVMSDTNGSGLLTLLSPFIRIVAKKAKKNGTEQWLIDKYCR